MKIDIHAHHAPPEFLAQLARNRHAYGCSVETDADGGLRVRFEDGSSQQVRPDLCDLDARLAAMHRRGLDKQVLLPPMSLNGYQLEPRRAQAFCRLFNETNAAVAQTSGGRLIAAATVPMQSSPAALEELEHAVQRLAIPVVALCTNVNGKNLDEDAFQPFFKRAAELGTLVVLHPHDVAASDRLGRYYLTNLIGNPLDTAIAAASLIFGGALERYASLNVCLVHGGGVLPYLLGRVSHGYRVAKACGTVPEGPEKYVRMLYYDTLVHDARALRFLSDVVGPDRLMLGTDYPYEMGEDQPLAELERAGLAEREDILGATAQRLLGLAPAGPR